MNWISIEDLSPKFDDIVVVYANDIVSGFYEIVRFKGDRFCAINGDDFPCIVTHWCKLEQPK